MNTRILMSILTIVAVVGGASAVTFAFFSDSGTNNDNIFAAGTIDLKMSDVGESVQDNITASFGGTNMVPGETRTGYFLIQNSGSHVANHAEVAVVNTDSDLINPLDAVLEVTMLKYDSVSVLSQLSDNNANSYVDLNDLATLGLDNLALTDLATDHTIEMMVTFRSTAGNQYQGDSVDSDWTITLNQDVTQ